MPAILVVTRGEFRIRADSVTGFDTLAAHFPGGAADPTVVLASTARAAQVQQAITATPGVASATAAGHSPTGLTKWSGVTDPPCRRPLCSKTLVRCGNG